MAGVDLRTVAQLLGHRTLQMVVRYSHLSQSHETWSRSNVYVRLAKETKDEVTAEVTLVRNRG